LEGKRKHCGNTFGINHGSIPNIKESQKHSTCFPFRVRVKMQLVSQESKTREKKVMVDHA
jgi:hypothetical protein